MRRQRSRGQGDVAEMVCPQQAALPLEQIQELLERYEEYLAVQVSTFVLRHPCIAERRELLDMDMDELKQRVRIKLWRALQRTPILHPKAYINHILYSEYVDMMRARHTTIPLLMDEHGEVVHYALMAWSEGMGDPADEVERRADDLEGLERAVAAVLELPPRQRLAMICTLRDYVDDVLLLTKMFKRYGVSIEEMQWPGDKGEKLLLRASLSLARRMAHIVKKGKRVQRRAR